MKVLVLNGSPKQQRSNTMYLTRAFLAGTQWNDVETIAVSNVSVKACLGCFACWNKTPGTCVIKDDMAEILSKIIAADVIIWSFPLYYFSVPGGLKNLIDRQLPLATPFMDKHSQSGSHPARYDLRHQKHIVISTCGFWTSSGNYDAVVAMFDHMCGRGNYTTLFCGQGELFPIPELKHHTAAYLDIVSRAGAEYAGAGMREETLRELETPLFPRDVFEQMADASWGIAKEEAAAPAAEGLMFTKQMAALYRPDGVERVVEFFYTDIQQTYQILMTKQGSQVLAEAFQPYTTKIETPLSLWQSIARGEISGQEALFQRQYKVAGDFDIMLHWDERFGVQKPNPGTASQNTNMLLLIIPWTIVWTAIAIHPLIGSIIGILAAACVPLLWRKFQPVIYEQVSIPLVISLCLAVLLHVDIRIIIPLSYLFFGLLWVIGAFPAIPLTAHYSAAKYGTDSAFANPLFIHTNRILTAVWGGLYLITPVWTYVFMGTQFAPYIGLVNTVIPLLLGIFTMWFQAWYPARWARG